ncbi:hypothetical protein BCR37DRAFT_381176 [Protomyces lactucae-debilis]|uniref:RRM domain-containing protein n=1 Tax=Protomyces lactucae-debilis TaxID=2754530 RepID=A0A1Y2FAL6_PROLT|nr:uncharacterized protein BCR37DRAFT_381176 [Protomyces lactucae-debilis]ORY80494.1 hypothetical protein BCR37DRAFT_381176 [Protomyces lactucae-debilis]
MVDAMEVDAASSSTRQPAESIEGWVVALTNVHEEAAEEDLQDLLADFGPVRNLQLNLDRRTGYVKGYALCEYAKRQEAEACIEQAKRQELKLLGQTLQADFAFVQPPVEVREKETEGRPKSSRRERSRERSQSPGRRG